jgi:hypothetical protein
VLVIDLLQAVRQILRRLGDGQRFHVMRLTKI